jgi:hypothetical protein
MPTLLKKLNVFMFMLGRALVCFRKILGLNLLAFTIEFFLNALSIGYYRK